MNLYVSCSSCHKDIKLEQKAKTKTEFKSNFGDTIEIRCPYCGTSNSIHVNSTFAKLDKSLYLIIGLLCVLTSIILTFAFSGFFLFIFFGPGILFFGEQKNINAYNQGMIPGR